MQNDANPRVRRLFRLFSWPIGWCALLFLVACGGPVIEPDDEAPLERGWQFFRLGDFPDALTGFEQALEEASEGTSDHAEALYALAVLWDLRRPGENRVRARELYERVLSGHPEHELAGWSSLALARMRHLTPVGVEPDIDDVRRAYRAVIEAHGGHPAAEEAALYYHATYIASMDPAEIEQALDGLRQFIERHAASGLISAAHALRAQGYQMLNKPEKQLAALVEAFDTREIDHTNPFYDNSWRYWELATCAEFAVGDFEAARYYYRRLIDEYPQDVRTYPSREALKRMDEVERRLLGKRRGDA